MSKTSKEFEEFAQLIEGSAVLVQSTIFPMAELADPDRAAQDSPEWRAADGVLAEKALERCRLGTGDVGGFTDWLVSVNHPGFDDYEAMVNDRIDHYQCP